MNMVSGALVSLVLYLGCLVGASVGQECGGVLTEPHGKVQSPGYPDFYPPNAHCKWVIQAPSNRKIILTFDDFNLDDKGNCISGDHLTVYSPKGESKVQIGDHLTVYSPKGESKVYCGVNIPPAIESFGNTLYVNFASDADENGIRFSLTYGTLAACEDGWQQFGSHCYFFSDEEMTFDEAQADCEARDANLTSIHSKEEQVKYVLARRLGQQTFGATNTGTLDNPFNYEFLDGTPSDYENIWSWNVYRPLNCLVGCGIVLVPDRWVNRDCSEVRPVICEATSSQGTGWPCFQDPMPDFCIHSSAESFTFAEGRAYCQQFLAADILTLPADLSFTAMLVEAFEMFFPTPRPRVGEFWIGLWQNASGIWQWSDGSPADLNRWEDGYPSDDGGQCAVITASSWDDLEKTYSASYVCKKPL
ncbi:unnamed protein product [Darwinula stevensoni]|uniref:Uncharacterized protein n=1 Tax=Darwinula stevensoni TaxID=69355 RepID=A0A7R8XK35_9CRUS|nr:unnamed protein product [Darwinula stevensoni]CAG0894797.1 unnamed protein product [Darwinula stevensoni]